MKATLLKTLALQDPTASHRPWHLLIPFAVEPSTSKETYVAIGDTSLGYANSLPRLDLLCDSQCFAPSLAITRSLIHVAAVWTACILCAGLHLWTKTRGIVVLLIVLKTRSREGFVVTPTIANTNIHIVAPLVIPDVWSVLKLKGHWQ